jgi:hypothetical protein
MELIPFLTQPPHERTLTGRGSRVYPNGQGSRVRPGRGRRCARALPLAARAVRSRLGLRPTRLALRACSLQIVHLNPISNPTPCGM